MSDDDERYEQMIAFIGSQLPAPVTEQPTGEGVLIFTGGSPAEVVVHLGASSVVVSEYAGVWATPDRFVVKPRRVGLLKWRRLSETAVMHALTVLIKGAREIRRSRYRPCTVCGEQTPPESLFSDDQCVECATEPRDIVH